MSWHFISSIGFYAFLGLLSSIPLTFLAAAVWGVDWRTAKTRLRAHADAWLEATDGDAIGKLLGLAGLSTIVLLLGGVAYTANHLGDSLMPYTSRATLHFGHEEVAWSIEHEKTGWRQLRYDYREISGIGADEVEWERAKVAMGRYDIRFFRTGVVLFGVLVLAGLWDLVRSASRKIPSGGGPSVAQLRRRAGGLLAVGIWGAITFQFLWAEREGRFVQNMVARYDNLYWSAHCDYPDLPTGYPSPRMPETEVRYEQRRAECLAGQTPQVESGQP